MLLAMALDELFQISSSVVRQRLRREIAAGWVTSYLIRCPKASPSSGVRERNEHLPGHFELATSRMCGAKRSLA